MDEKPPVLDLYQVPLPANLAAADSLIDQMKLPPANLPPGSGMDFMKSITIRELIVLRKVTLRVHRQCVGPFERKDPNIYELDEMICAVGPVASENMLRRAVDEKLGEFERGKYNRSQANDSEFLHEAKKI